MSRLDHAALFRFRLGRPDLDDIPDEAVVNTFTYQQWAFAEALDLLWRAIKVAFAELPIIRRILR